MQKKLKKEEGLCAMCCDVSFQWRDGRKRVEDGRCKYFASAEVIFFQKLICVRRQDEIKKITSLK